MSGNMRNGDPAEKRRSPRTEIFLKTTLSVGRKSPMTAQIVNISPHGFMARVQSEVLRNESVSVRLPVVGQVQAGIAWVLGNRIGCNFETPFEEPAYADLIAAIKSVRPNWQETEDKNQS